MEEIVTALVKLCQEASSGEVFLLASAALANITFFDTMACEMLLHLNAMKILLAACADKQIVDTPYSRDQVVTILANMSVLDQCASEIIQGNGIPRLIELCRSPTERNNSDSVLVACLVGALKPSFISREKCRNPISFSEISVCVSNTSLL
ncbi:Protein inscuteable like protein [Chelonia mydas]|uniref:Protein inscuteable like protein n=1 Tax=Chelonia mydas TaxID=8469 RepID=M7BRE3_CHEMY|nr:Protein inscuteable like protein [Chelonia mydas]